MPVKEVVGVDVAVDHLAMSMDMPVNQIYPEQQFLVPKNLVHISYFFDAVLL